MGIPRRGRCSIEGPSALALLRAERAREGPANMWKSARQLLRVGSRRLRSRRSSRLIEDESGRSARYLEHQMVELHLKKQPSSCRNSGPAVSCRSPRL